MNTGYINQFIISVRSNEYEPTFLRSLVANLELQLKKKGYSASLTNDLVIEKTRDSLLQAKTTKESRKGK